MDRIDSGRGQSQEREYKLPPDTLAGTILMRSRA
jgi:hypothetical protein